jgi:cytochrome c
MVASPAIADGDVKKGKRVYNKCKVCHFVDKEKNKLGPHLVGLFGRKAGTLEGYKFSKAMKASNIVWSAETLASYVANPKKAVPGTKMVFAGVKKKKQIVNLIAYLEQATKKAK